MKKLLIRLSLRILKKWCIQTLLPTPGTFLYYGGHFFEVQTISVTHERGRPTTLEINAKTGILEEV